MKWPNEQLAAHSPLPNLRQAGRLITVGRAKLVREPNFLPESCRGLSLSRGTLDSFLTDAPWVTGLHRSHSASYFSAAGVIKINGMSRTPRPVRESPAGR